MIIRRRKLPRPPSQAVIAYDLGVVLPSRWKHLLPRSHAATPKFGGGTRINIKKYSLTVFFKKWGYQLQETAYRGTNFGSVRSFRKFLINNLVNGNDLLVCYHYPTLWMLPGSWGHGVLIESVGNKFVTICDPYLPKGKRCRVQLSRLFNAIGEHGAYYGRVDVISASN